MGMSELIQGFLSAQGLRRQKQLDAADAAMRAQQTQWQRERHASELAGDAEDRDLRRQDQALRKRGIEREEAALQWNQDRFREDWENRKARDRQAHENKISALNAKNLMEGAAKWALAGGDPGEFRMMWEAQQVLNAQPGAPEPGVMLAASSDPATSAVMANPLLPAGPGAAPAATGGRVTLPQLPPLLAARLMQMQAQTANLEARTAGQLLKNQYAPELERANLILRQRRATAAGLDAQKKRIELPFVAEAAAQKMALGQKRIAYYDQRMTDMQADSARETQLHRLKMQNGGVLPGSGKETLSKLTGEYDRQRNKLQSLDRLFMQSEADLDEAEAEAQQWVSEMDNPASRYDPAQLHQGAMQAMETHKKLLQNHETIARWREEQQNRLGYVEGLLSEQGGLQWRTPGGKVDSRAQQQFGQQGRAQGQMVAPGGVGVLSLQPLAEAAVGQMPGYVQDMIRRAAGGGGRKAPMQPGKRPFVAPPKSGPSGRSQSRPFIDPKNADPVRLNNAIRGKTKSGKGWSATFMPR